MIYISYIIEEAKKDNHFLQFLIRMMKGPTDLLLEMR